MLYYSYRSTLLGVALCKNIPICLIPIAQSRPFDYIIKRGESIPVSYLASWRAKQRIYAKSSFKEHRSGWKIVKTLFFLCNSIPRGESLKLYLCSLSYSNKAASEKPSGREVVSVPQKHIFAKHAKKLSLWDGGNNTQIFQNIPMCHRRIFYQKRYRNVTEAWTTSA